MADFGRSFERRGAGPWYARGLRFQCLICGRCCGGQAGYIWISPEEIQQAARMLGLRAGDFRSLYVAEYDRGLSLREMASGDCCMLHNGRCRIYAVRPLQCRTWPFWPSNLSSPRAWQEAAARCPGIGSGRLWTVPQIEAQRKRMLI